MGDRMATSNGVQIVLGVGAAFAIAGLVIWLVPAPEVGPRGYADPSTEAQPSPTVSETQETSVGATGANTDALDNAAQEPESPNADTVAEPVVDETVAEEAAVDEPVAIVEVAKGPSVDTFRFDPDGSLVIAGRAEPFQLIELVVGNEPFERTEASGDGSFVVLSLLPFSDQSRAIFVVADPDGARLKGDQTYLIGPMVAPVLDAEEIVIAEAPVEEDAGNEAIIPTVDALLGAEDVLIAEENNAAVVTDGVTTEPVLETALAIETEETPVEDTVVAEPEVKIVEPTVLVADQDGVRVVQSPLSENGPVVANVALDSITYDPSGEVSIAGRASGDGYVRVYLDNQPITTSRIVEGGDWRTPLPDIDTGVFTLRVDEVSAEGDVISRIETPFKREEPETIAAVMAEETDDDDFQIAVKTVQPGATLWAIAEERFGAGIRYVEVFEANRDLIKDPDLIFPGQVFRIPQTE